MTNTIEQVLVYFSVGLDVRSSDGTPTPLQVSKVTVQLRPMTTGEFKKLSDLVSKSIDVAKACIEISKTFIKNSDLKKYLDYVAGVGDIIKGFGKFVPSPENPVIAELKKLDNKIEEVGEKMSQGFDEMKAYITEVTFFMKIMSPTSVLTKFMRDCLRKPGPLAIEEFRKAYARNSPIKLAYSLLSYLERKNTNPLRMAMDAEYVKTTATFDKWQGIISGLLAEFLFLEAFACGLIGNEDHFNWDRLTERSLSIFTTLDNWREEYKEDTLYWKEIEVYLEKWLKDNKIMSNKQKADEIRKKLDTYLTNDAFYIVVFNNFFNNQDFYWEDIKADRDQYLKFYWGTDGNVFIYRSRQANSTEVSNFESLQHQVEELETNGDQKKIITKLQKQPITNAGFTILIGALKEETRHANYTRGEKGPGWYTDTFGGPIPRKLLVGYI